MRKVKLRALEPEDYRVTHNWRLDDSTSSVIVGIKRFVSLETERNWILQAISNHEAAKILRFVICFDDNPKPLGLVTCSDIDLVNKSCAVSYMVDPECRGMGLAGRALSAVITYMIENMGVLRVSCKILEQNIASQKLAMKVGMIKEGVLRKAVYKNGEFQDLLCFGLLVEEFSPVKLN